MSIDLVSKSLALDLETTDTRCGKKKKKNTTNNAMDLIKTNRQGVWNELRKFQKKQRLDVIEKKKKKKFKSAIELYKEENDTDYTSTNVEALLRITELGKVRDQVAEKILHQQPNRLSRDIKVEKDNEQQGTVFTEEDFKKFEREYQSK